MSEPVVERIEAGSRFARVNPAWRGRTVAVLAGGPSLTPEQAELCRGIPCIAVNDQYLLAPWAEVLYFADGKWWKWQITGRDGKGHEALRISAADLKARWAAFPGIKVSIDNSAAQIADDQVLILRNANSNAAATPVSTDPAAIQTGGNSGFQAFNIALLAQPARILLLGFDAQRGTGGRRHNFGDHPDRSEPPYDAMCSAFRNAGEAVKRLGIEVLNCSPVSKIDCFPFMALADALSGMPAPVLAPAATLPGAVTSVYVRVSDRLRGVAGLTFEALAGEFSNERAALERALRKGAGKGTLLERDGLWRHASRLQPDP